MEQFIKDYMGGFIGFFLIMSSIIASHVRSMFKETLKRIKDVETNTKKITEIEIILKEIKEKNDKEELKKELRKELNKEHKGLE